MNMKTRVSESSENHILCKRPFSEIVSELKGKRHISLSVEENLDIFVILNLIKGSNRRFVLAVFTLFLRAYVFV